MFDLGQTMSAIYYILKHVSGPVDFKKLLKLLYMADRQSVLETGIPITGDDLVAMPKGPVLKSVYALLTDETAPNRDLFTTFFSAEDNSIQLKKEFTYDWLSPFTENILDTICREYGNGSDDELSEMTHHLPEWNFGSLSWENVMRANGHEELISQYHDSFSSLFPDTDRDEILEYA